MSTETALRLVVPAEPEQTLPPSGPEVVIDLAVDLADDLDRKDVEISQLHDYIDHLESLPGIAPEPNWAMRAAITGIVIGIILMASANYMLAGLWW